MQCCLFMGIAVLGYWVGGKPAAVLLLGVGGALGWRAYRYQPTGVLALTSSAALLHGHWLQPHDRQSVESGPSEVLGEGYLVRCDYLGPWLIGLYVGKQRVWLWPDSAPQECLREVRRLLHHPGR